MKKTIISLSVAALFSSGVAQAMGPVTVTTTGNNFSMVGGTNLSTGGNNDTTFTWDGTYRTSVVTDGSFNATLSSPSKFGGYTWVAHHVNIYSPGTYTFETDCTAGNPSPGCTTDPINATNPAGLTYTMTVGAGKVAAHMLFDWGAVSSTACGRANCNIDVVVLWDMDKSWAQTGTVSVFKTTAGSANDINTVWAGVSIDTDMDADTFSGTKMIDGAFIGQSANFNVNGITVATTPTVSPSDQVPSNNATAVAPNAATSVAVTFSEAMNVASVQSAFTVNAGGNICTGIAASIDNKTFTCTHDALALSTLHTATVSIGAKSAKGIPLASAVTWSFTTHSSNDGVAPSVSGALTPLNATANALNTQPIVITFSEPMAGTTANAMVVTANGVAVAGQFNASNNNQTFTFVPTSGVLPNSSNIVVTVPAAGAVADIAGNPLAVSPAWGFSTEVPASITASGSNTNISIITGGNLVSAEPLSAATAENQAVALGKSVPTGITFNNGFVKYTVNGVASGGAATIRIVFPSVITGKAIYKFKQSTGDYVLLGVGVGANQYQEVNSTTIDMNVVDGGLLDDDGAANTIIVDPVGDATPVVGAVATTLGSAGGGGGCTVDPSGKDASLLVALLASLGYVGWRRRGSKH